MTEGQKIALFVFLTLIFGVSIVVRNRQYGTFDMGSRAGTFGFMAAAFAFFFGGLVAAIYPETVISLSAFWQ
ncbi:hypothetical protein [Rhizobium sp. Leaf386]|uniref:hypothetical protein n=1 Tax=Rhizobium sp. Leaf386 TaxID=1736359 RepID=UPI0007142C32|nr:hypothetical protein [Rhizobium sp. Leaf386]KQT04866.1 hypothetical protein ASG50_16670 [Rhizobium sp. Leaf386]